MCGGSDEWCETILVYTQHKLSSSKFIRGIDKQNFMDESIWYIPSPFLFGVSYLQFIKGIPYKTKNIFSKSP
jgi:hypothetical protein